MSKGVFDILGPRVLITHCNATVTFNYRTSDSGGVKITTSLLVLNISEDNTVISNQTVATAAAELFELNRTFVCFSLICGNDLNMSLSIGQLKITIAVGGGDAEISDVDFQDNTACRGQSTRKDAS